MEEELVTIRRYFTPWEAHVAAARLEEEGIPCAVENEESATVFGAALAFVKLKVRESDSERATQMLDQIEEQASEAEDEAQ
jgi:hypothetical protein